MFNAIDPSLITWRFDSRNLRDGDKNAQPPYRSASYTDDEKFNNSNDYLNDFGPSPSDDPDTKYFDSSPVPCVIHSYQKNIVIDNLPPELLSWSGTFTVFKSEIHTQDMSGRSGSRRVQTYVSDDKSKWRVQLIFRDQSGIDYDIYQIRANGQIVCGMTRKTSGDDHRAVPDPSVQPLDGLTVKIEKSSIDSSMYLVELEIDPEAMNEAGVLEKCTDEVSFMSIGLTLWDIAGNEIVADIDRELIYFNIEKSALVESARKLSLSFVDTYPSNLFVDRDMIGKTTVSVDNPNELLSKYGFKVHIGLSDGSVGYAAGDAREIDDGRTALQEVDGIDRSGYVRAFAYLDGDQEELTCDVSGSVTIKLDEDLAAEIRGLTYTEGSLGPFITECETNIRKIYIDKFVPGVLKSEEIYGLCKHLERFLNTMYSPMNGDCRIGVLEKIDRISKFKDPDSCEADLIPNFVEEHGGELSFNRSDLVEVAEILQTYVPESERTETVDEIAESIYRRYCSIIPYIDRMKGTSRCFDLIYGVLGIDVEVIPLWEGPNGDMVPEDQAGDDYTLTGHLNLKLRSSNMTARDVKKISDFIISAVRSLIPITKVIGDIIAEEVMMSDSSTITAAKIELDTQKTVERDDGIMFIWPDGGTVKRTNSGGSIEISAFPAETRGTYDTCLPGNCLFYFTRFFRYSRYYKDPYIVLSFADVSGNSVTKNSEMRMKVKTISGGHGRVMIELDVSDRQTSEALRKYSMNSIAGGSLVAAFRYSRSVDNFCKSVTIEEYESQVGGA